MNLPKAISYARFSSGKQAKGSSLDRQKQAFNEWLEQHKDAYEPLRFADEGVSAYRGKNASRGHLAHLLTMIDQGSIAAGDLLVIESFDRLSRQETLETFDLVREVLRHGIDILTLEDSRQYSKTSLNGTDIYALIANVQAAHSYSKRLGERVSAAHQNKRRRARSGGPVANVVTASWIESGRIKEPYGSLVRKAVELYLKGNGHRQIVIELQSKIQADPALKLKYAKLNASTVRKWLSAEELVGNWESKEGRIVGCFEPLISNVDYQRIQQEKARRTKTPSKSSDYELSGIVRCKLCGAPYHTRRKRVEGKPEILYCNCSNYLKNGTCVNNTTWPYQVLLFIYNYGLSSVLADVYMQRNIVEAQTAEAKALDEEIAKLKNSQDSAENLYRVTRKTKYLDEVEALTKELNALSARLEDLTQQTAARTVAKSSSECIEGDNYAKDLRELEALPLIELRALLKQFNYVLSVEGKSCTLSASPDGREIFTLIRRVQKHANAYVLRVELPEVPDPTENCWVKYHAIDQKGRAIASANTDSQLMASLEQIGYDAGR